MHARKRAFTLGTLILLADFFASLSVDAAGALWWLTAGVARLDGASLTHFILEGRPEYGYEAVGVDAAGVVWLADFRSFPPPEEER